MRTVVPILVNADKLQLVSRSSWRNAIESLADLACAATRHRFCHRIYSPAWSWAEKTEKVVFETQITADQARAIFPFLGGVPLNILSKHLDTKHA